MEMSDVLTLLQRKIENAETQAAVAKEIGVSPQYLSDVMNGYRTPSDKILDYLGLKWDIVKDRS